MKRCIAILALAGCANGGGHVFEFHGDPADFAVAVSAANHWEKCGVHVDIVWPESHVPGAAPIDVVDSIGEGTVGVTTFHPTQIRYVRSGRLTEAVLTHEIGHALGAKHVEDKDDTMYPFTKTIRVGEGDCSAVD